MLNAADVLRQVAATGYRFTAVTPLTHQRVLARRGREPGATLRDIFGWNLPFEARSLPPELLAGMERAGIVRREGSLLRSTVRIASLGDDLFFHSAYPTVEENAVFFGPDTSRFARFIRHALASREAQRRSLRVLDVGCGSGAGGVAVARALAATGTPATVVMNDINPLALQYTAINAEVAGVEVTLAQGDALSAVDGEFDLIVSNPPSSTTLRSAPTATAARGWAGAQRAHRGGVAEAAGTGRAVAALHRRGDGRRRGSVPCGDAAAARGTGPGMVLRRDRPDVFGEELERPVYAHIDRIAAVGLVATRAAEAA